MENKVKIATWRLCLGLVNKKDYVTEVLREQKIDICCLQEVDLATDFDHQLLSTKDYTLLIEKNEWKSRCGVYIKSGIKNCRRTELEGMNKGLVIVDIDLECKYKTTFLN